MNHTEQNKRQHSGTWFMGKDNGCLPAFLILIEVIPIFLNNMRDFVKWMEVKELLFLSNVQPDSAELA